MSPTTDVGTYPPGSQWRKNPVPMCNCDIGLNCKDKNQEDDDAAVELRAHFEVSSTVLEWMH